jgi:hypothetical protein
MRLGLDLCLTSMHLATNHTRLVRKSKPTESFFNFFSPPQPPSDDAIESGDLDEEELEEIESKLEVDYQIGEDFKEKVRAPGPRHILLTPLTLTQIVPRAIDYFTGKALDYEMMEDDEDDYEDIEEDDDEEFEDEVCMSWIFTFFDDKAYWLTGAGMGWRRPAWHATGSTSGCARWCRRKQQRESRGMQATVIVAATHLLSEYISLIHCSQEPYRASSLTTFFVHFSRVSVPRVLCCICGR